MIYCDPLLAQPRVRDLIRTIVNGYHRRMPCGDVRLATTLTNRGLIVLGKPSHREYTTSYLLTPEGKAVLLSHPLYKEEIQP